MRECPGCGGNMIKDRYYLGEYYCEKCMYETRKN